MASGFDAMLPEPLVGWRLHDLRRTARTLMSRVDVPRTTLNDASATSLAVSVASMTVTPLKTRSGARSRPWPVRSSGFAPEVTSAQNNFAWSKTGLIARFSAID